MSIQQTRPDLPVWCALGTNNLSRVEIPEKIREILIAADADETGEAAARCAAQRFEREGRRVAIAYPGVSGSGLDFNDLLTR